MSHLDNLLDTLELLFEAPRMWVSREEFHAVGDFLTGLDVCCNDLDLNDGFCSWLISKLHLSTSSYAWPGLVLQIAGIPPDAGRVFPGRERELIDLLKVLLFEYLDERPTIRPRYRRYNRRRKQRNEPRGKKVNW